MNLGEMEVWLGPEDAVRLYAEGEVTVAAIRIILDAGAAKALLNAAEQILQLKAPNDRSATEEK